MADITVKEPESPQTRSSILERRDRKTRSTQRMRQDSQDAQDPKVVLSPTLLKMDSEEKHPSSTTQSQQQNVAPTPSESQQPSVSNQSQFQALIDERINPSLSDYKLPKKSKSPKQVAPVAITPSYMMVEERKQRPKSSGVLSSNSTTGLHRVKYTPQPATVVKSQLPRHIENKSSEEKITPRNISFTGQNKFSHSMIHNSNDNSVPMSIFENNQGSSDDGGRILNKEIRTLRKQLMQNLNQINFIALNEVEYIKRPQKYMIFAAKLFKILFDLVSST